VNQTRIAFFWVITRCIFVIPNRRFVTTYRTVGKDIPLRVTYMSLYLLNTEHDTFLCYVCVLPTDRSTKNKMDAFLRKDANVTNVQKLKKNDTE